MHWPENMFVTTKASKSAVWEKAASWESVWITWIKNRITSTLGYFWMTDDFHKSIICCTVLVKCTALVVADNFRNCAVVLCCFPSSTSLSWLEDFEKSSQSLARRSARGPSTSALAMAKWPSMAKHGQTKCSWRRLWVKRCAALLFPHFIEFPTGTIWNGLSNGLRPGIPGNHHNSSG